MTLDEHALNWLEGLAAKAADRSLYPAQAISYCRELHVACTPQTVLELIKLARTTLTAAGHIPEKGWRKIESAPKDVAVLTYGFGYEVAHFNAALDCWVACWDHRPIRPPTEWQPLPSPPSQEWAP